MVRDTWRVVNPGGNNSQTLITDNDNDLITDTSDTLVTNTEIETDLIDVRAVDAFNRFARSATLRFRDPDGTKQSDIGLYNRLRLDVRDQDETQWTEGRFHLFGVAHDWEGGVYEIECVSHDHWLRRQQSIIYTASSESLSSILETLIKEQCPPVAWDANEVSVANDVSISREWRGVSLDEVLFELASISDDEEFGVKIKSGTPTFFFQERDTTTAPRQFTEDQYVTADWDETGKKEVNKVTVYYGSGSNRKGVVVEDRADQEQKQDDLNLDGGGSLHAVHTYEEIDNEDAAFKKGEELLESARGILTGTLESWDGFDLTPGDVTRAVAPQEGIDTSFRIARIEYAWREDVTRVTLARNQEGVIDVLLNLSGRARRVENRRLDPDATTVNLLKLEPKLGLNSTITVIEYTIDSDTIRLGGTRAGFGGKMGGGVTNRTEHDSG